MDDERLVKEIAAIERIHAAAFGDGRRVAE
jgi:hypothetical protein